MLNQSENDSTGTVIILADRRPANAATAPRSRAPGQGGVVCPLRPQLASGGDAKLPPGNGQNLAHVATGARRKADEQSAPRGDGPKPAHPGITEIPIERWDLW